MIKSDGSITSYRVLRVHVLILKDDSSVSFVMLQCFSCLHSESNPLLPAGRIPLSSLLFYKSTAPLKTERMSSKYIGDKWSEEVRRDKNRAE